MTDRPRDSLIPSRVMLIGEGQIPAEVMEALEDRLLGIFMREPDPEKWPPEMGHLVQYLSAEEQTKHSIFKILKRHDHLLGECLQAWASTTWAELIECNVVSPVDRAMILGEMAQHVKALLDEYLREI